MNTQPTPETDSALKEKYLAEAKKFDQQLQIKLATEMEITFKEQRRLASENPRVVEYRYSDRPDEIFTDRKLLQKNRGLTDEQVQQTMTIYEPK